MPPPLHSSPTTGSSTPCPPALDTVPDLIESILATAIRSIARPILYASAPHIATYINAASRRYTGIAPSHAAIYRMPWIDSTLAARLGNLWLLRQLANLASRSDRHYRPLQYNHLELAHHAGASGNLDLVQYLVQDTILLEQNLLGSVIQHASMHGHVHILDWFAAHCPGAFESLGPGAQFQVPPATGMGAEYLLVLQWWMDRQHLWVGPASDKARHDWQLRVLVNACKAKRMDVVEYWVCVQDCKQIEPADPGRLREHLAWPLAAAAYTGDLEFFAQMRGVWPDAVGGTVLAFACGSGNLELAKYCHALLVGSASDAQQAQGKIIDKQAMDLCYLLATAAGGGQGDQAAITMLNWLHTDLDFHVTGQHAVTDALWFRRILPSSWPGDWGSCAPQHFVMDVATRLASTALLDWWHVHAAKEAGRGSTFQLTFFNDPQLAATQVQHVDPTHVLQWWIDSGLVPAVHRQPSFEVLLLVGGVIGEGGRVEMLDWLLAQLLNVKHDGGGDGDGDGGCDGGEVDVEDMFPSRIMSMACQAGRVDVLEWIVNNEDKLPWSVFCSSVFDDAYRYGHVHVLQWLFDGGYFDELRAKDIERGGPYEYWAISFMSDEWPGCFECLEWSLYYGFKVSKSMYKEVEAKCRVDSGNTLYLHLIQREPHW